MIKISEEFMIDLSDKARCTTRKRQNFTFHKSDNDTLQRMLNALEPESYTHPHKHENPDKREVFLILKGRVLVVEFNPTGKIVDHIILNEKGKNKGVEFPPGSWHTLISLEKGSVVYELKDGPYDKKSDKTFAPWAPNEGQPGADTFNEKILKQLHI